MRSLRNAFQRIAATGTILLIAGLCFCTETAAAQQPSANLAVTTSPIAVSSFAPYAVPARQNVQPVALLQFGPGAAASSAEASGGAPSVGPRKITLDEAQDQAAAAAGKALLHLATLGVDAAKQHRLGAEADYFPKVTSSFGNFHFNKFMGEFLSIQGPRGNGINKTLPLFEKDQTFVASSAMQPVTPLFKLHQVVKLARADERIAKAKAGQPVSQLAAEVEQSYFGLLVAQRQNQIAVAGLKTVESKWRVASNGTLPAGLGEHEMEWIEADKVVVAAESKVKQAAASLNMLLGWPLDTELDLVMPAAFYDNVSKEEAVEKAIVNNPEVVEAVQTREKAKAGSRLSKLDYVPDVAVTGGYVYQTVSPLIRPDFSYVGIVANYTLFDFGKRERTMKERSTQVEMAETGVQLTKAKVAAAVTRAYLDLERTRKLGELARRMNSASRAVEVSYDPEQATAARAKVELEVLQAEIEYRLAFSRLQQLMGVTAK
jgi:outer membrane protein TolC